MGVRRLVSTPHWKLTEEEEAFYDQNEDAYLALPDPDTEAELDYLNPDPRTDEELEVHEMYEA